MKFFRNPEVKRELIILTLITVLCTGTLFLCAGLKEAAAFFPATLLFSCFHFLSTYRRHQKIIRLTEEIDAFLHGYTPLSIHGQREGELAILETEISKMTHRLKQQAENLQADKIYLLNSITDISHQIRTPLTSLNLISSRLSQSTLTDSMRLQLVHELDALLRHIDWLIEALLKISKLDAGTIHMKEDSVSVEELFEASSRELAIPMELRGQTLSIDCPDGTAFQGDFFWMKEALNNIMKNCMEHTPEGGHLCLDAYENAIFTEITISDNGPGISKKDLPHLFERFYKGENSSRQSVGIGLALAHMIVVNQGGTITAENDRKGGARFQIRFYKSVV